MNKSILSKIKKAKVLSPEELTELESALSTTNETKSPKDEVSKPVEPNKDEPKEVAPVEPAMDKDKPIGEPLEEKEPTEMETPVETNEPKEMPGEPLPPMSETGPATDAPKDAPVGEVPPVEPPVDAMTPNEPPVANVGTETGVVSTGDLEQVKTTISALESKIRSLEEVLSKLSVSGEPAQDKDFGLSGTGKAVANGEPNDDKVGAMIKKMGGFSK